MTINEIDIPYSYTNIEFDKLSIPMAIEFRNAILKSDYSTYQKVGKIYNSYEVIFFQIEPEVSQKPVNDIRYKEPIAVIFDRNNNNMPEIYSLREDFPLVSHLNLTSFEKPKSLCLYETPFVELKRVWNSKNFLYRIREWLSLTSQGILHQKDQPLEPFFLETSGEIVFPNNVDTTKKYILINRSSEKQSKYRILAVEESCLNDSIKIDQDYELIMINTKPQVHGILKETPTNLHLLNNLLKTLGVNLVDDYLIPRLEKLQLVANNSSHSKHFILLLKIPKKKDLNDIQHYYEYVTFVILNKSIDLALAIKYLVSSGRHYAPPIPKEIYQNGDLGNVSVTPLKTYFINKREDSSAFNGIKHFDGTVGLIGVGALGSQVFAILNKMGWGKWKIIDSDIILPHNLSRHYLTEEFILMSKAESIVKIMSNICENNQPNEALCFDFLDPINQAKLNTFYTETNLIIDISTSIAVSRKLSHENSKSRNISIFLNPSGNNLVMLVEPQSKEVRLDQIEMQYYRFICEEESLQNHLMPNGEPLRYSAACRDVSTTIPQDNIVAFSGIASKAIREINEQESGVIKIWSLNDNNNVVCSSKRLFNVSTRKIDDWSIVFDDYLIEKIRTHRNERLPNETGGILVGSYDYTEKIIYVVDSILSPPDSKEFPHSYIRGIIGVESKLELIAARTAHKLQYIGEWHSHPDGTTVNRSNDDIKLFNWIKDYLDESSLPPLMIIVGEKNKLGIYIN